MLTMCKNMNFLLKFVRGPSTYFYYSSHNPNRHLYDFLLPRKCIKCEYVIKWTSKWAWKCCWKDDKLITLLILINLWFHYNCVISWLWTHDHYLKSVIQQNCDSDSFLYVSLKSKPMSSHYRLCWSSERIFHGPMLIFRALWAGF